MCKIETNCLVYGSVKNIIMIHKIKICFILILFLIFTEALSSTSNPRFRQISSKRKGFLRRNIGNSHLLKNNQINVRPTNLRQRPLRTSSANDWINARRRSPYGRGIGRRNERFIPIQNVEKVHYLDLKECEEKTTAARFYRPYTMYNCDYSHLNKVSYNNVNTFL